MNKKAILISVLCSSAFFLSGCSKEQEISKTPENVYETVTSETQVRGEENEVWSAAEHGFPSMEVLGTAQALETGIKSELLEISYCDAMQREHTVLTDESFKRLLSGDTDLIICSSLSEAQKQEAEKAGVKLSTVIPAKQAFVFMVNKDNPVDSLTKEQLKDIYSGKITNWSELGGPDEDIMSFQRNEDSVSQSCMNEFMEDRELAEPLISLAVYEDRTAVERTAVYDNSKNALDIQHIQMLFLCMKIQKI